MKFLCSADLHIGRSSSRLSGDVPARLASTAEVWSRLVAAAIELEVDAVLLAGDVVDRKNRFFEATGPLETGLRILRSAGIECVAVCGNHDFDVLPALARDLEDTGFRVLGPGGRWERHLIERNGERVEIHGWSFPALHHREDPLASYDLDGGSGIPALGLLHGDLEVTGSSYGPVRLSALRSLPAAAWVLGHVHARAEHSGPGAPVHYTGSPQALDPGEPGEHGALLLDVGTGGAVSSRVVPLSSVRYETRAVDVSGLDDDVELSARVAGAVRQALEEVGSGSGPLRLLSLRLSLHGRTPLHRFLPGILSSLAEDLKITSGDVMGVVERVTFATAPDYDLAALARGSDAPAVIASLIQSLRIGALDDRQRALLAKVDELIRRVHAAPHYQGVRDPGDAPEPRPVLEDRALLLLDTLLAQREAA